MESVARGSRQRPGGFARPVAISSETPLSWKHKQGEPEVAVLRSSEEAQIGNPRIAFHSLVDDRL